MLNPHYIFTSSLQLLGLGYQSLHFPWIAPTYSSKAYSSEDFVAVFTRYLRGTQQQTHPIVPNTSTYIPAMDPSSRVNTAQKIIIDLLTIREAQRTAARAIASLTGAEQPSTPPPAYQDHFERAPNVASQPQVNMNHPQAHLFAPQQHSPTVDPYASYEEAETETMPSISISITSSLSVNGSNNVIGLDTARNAATIGRALVDAIKNTSMSAMGIPMIDEEGKPRTINVTVDAGMRVEGRDNIIGEEIAMMRLDILQKQANRGKKRCANGQCKKAHEETPEERQAQKEEEEGQETNCADEDEDEEGDDDSDKDEDNEADDDAGTVAGAVDVTEAKGDEASSTAPKRRRDSNEGLRIHMNNTKRPCLE